MNENIDLTKILKNVPKGTEFYSSVYGNCIFTGITKESPQISFKYGKGCVFSLYKNGNSFEDRGECIVFPSKYKRDWSNFEYVENYNNKEFTKGPWFVNRKMPGFGMDIRITRFEESSYWKEGHVALAGDYPLATIHTGHKNWENGYPVEENAKLIAAAPELFEALEPFTWFPDEDFIEEEAELSYTLTVRVKHIIAAKRAIKKAKK